MIEIVKYRSQPGGYSVYTLWPFRITLTWETDRDLYFWTYALPVLVLFDLLLLVYCIRT